MSDTNTNLDHWTNRAPSMLRDTLTGPDGEPCFTTTDRRWLWHLENAIAVHAPMGSDLEQFRRDLRQYLDETCEHHWQEWAGDDQIAAHRQCLWCSDVEWTGGAR